MSISDDFDSDLLISRLAGSLTPAARQAFRRPAEDALARLPCVGEGAIYRTVAPLQRAYFDPPDDYRASWDISRDCWSSKLVKQPARMSYWAVSRLAPRREALALARW